MTTETTEPEIAAYSRQARQAMEEHWETVLIAALMCVAVIAGVIAVAKYIQHRRRKSLLHRVVDYLEDLGGHRERVEKLLKNLE